MSEFSCGYCQKSFHTLPALKSHVTDEHVDDFPAKTGFKNNSGLGIPPKGNGRIEFALSSVTAVDEFRCFPCRLGFENEQRLKSHIEQEHRNKNKLFDVEITSNKRARKRREIDDANDVGEPEVTDAESLPDVVEQVPADGVSGERVQIPEASKTAESSCWSCSVCAKTFRFKSRLERHFVVHRNVADVDVKRQFECQVCQKKFLRSG